jgi:hypothetical protein
MEKAKRKELSALPWMFLVLCGSASEEIYKINTGI